MAYELQEGTLTKKTLLCYILIYFVLECIFTSGSFIQYSFQDSNYKSLLIWDLFYLATTVFFIVLAFKKNEQGDGNFFLERILCLSFPILIRILVYSIPFVLFIYAMLGLIADNQIEKYNTFILEAYEIGAVVLSYILAYRWVHRISHGLVTKN
ncbi:MAG: hypothetical protein R3A45_09980 [Bdellovibrionota bacterium]